MKIIPASIWITIASLCATSASDQASSDCNAVASRALAAAKRASVDPVKLLNLIDREILTNPDCACEIVKAAIIGTQCDDAMVGYIVETAVRASPENMRLISQCAIATAPGSITRVQEIMGRLDPGAGQAQSAKSSKDAKGLEVKAIKVLPNPLDLPVIVAPPVPPIINPPPSTPTNFLAVPAKNPA